MDVCTYVRVFDFVCVNVYVFFNVVMYVYVCGSLNKHFIIYLLLFLISVYFL